MKYQLSDHDKKQFVSDLETNPVLKFLKAKDSLRFNIGDILIRQQYRYHGPHGTRTWTTDCVSVHSKAPKKFVYVYENELGVGYVKQLKADGSGFTSYMCCMANIDPSYTRFVVDPEFADHMLLSESNSEFTPGEQFQNDKARREDIKKFNRGIAEKTSTCSDVNQAIKKMSIGMKIWFGSGLVNATEIEYTVKDIRAGNGYPIDLDTKEYFEIDLTYTDYWNTPRNLKVNTNILRGQRLFLVKPKLYKDET